MYGISTAPTFTIKINHPISVPWILWVRSSHLRYCRSLGCSPPWLWLGHADVPSQSAARTLLPSWMRFLQVLGGSDSTWDVGTSQSRWIKRDKCDITILNNDMHLYIIYIYWTTSKYMYISYKYINIYIYSIGVYAFHMCFMLHQNAKPTIHSSQKAQANYPSVQSHQPGLAWGHLTWDCSNNSNPHKITLVHTVPWETVSWNPTQKSNP